MKKRILIKYEGKFKGAYNMFDTYLRYLQDSNISIVRYSKLALVIETEHVEIRILTYYDNTCGLRADEVFGFTDKEIKYLRRDGLKYKYPDTWLDYVIAEERVK